MIITAQSLDGQRDSLLMHYSADLPDGTLAHILAVFTAWERIVDSAEALYAVRSSLTAPWHDYLVNLLQFLSLSGFGMNTEDAGRTRAPAMLAEVITPGEDAPEPVAKYLPVEEG